MSINKRRDAKKKQREKEVKSKVEKRRAATRAISREQLLEFRQQRQFKKDQKEYAKLEKTVDEFYNSLPQATKEKLEKNIEILKALEEEHQKEIAEKENLNEELEQEGNLTLKSKMEALHKKALDSQKDCAVVDVVKSDPDTKLGVGGSADCSFKPNS